MAAIIKDPNGYRATFRYPHIQGGIQVKIAAPMTIEVFQATGEHWQARFVASETQQRYGKLPKFLGAGATVTAICREDAQRNIEASFQEKIIDWMPYDLKTGEPYIPPKPAAAEAPASSSPEAA